jgi:cell division protein FtsB
MKRLTRAIVLIAVIIFAVQGGEYSTTDLFHQWARKRQLSASIDSLRREVDSLTAWRRAVATDPAVQERIAREEFGMVRGDREILYRFADVDTAARGLSTPVHGDSTRP